ncbi:hypothetical protein MAUB_48120 [Mycolicibacterium aubagnense]|uniref:PE cleavage protein A C-terminal domain-containing protein n=1 Tax=Mycolicibacterium aubagnense TaxID=319707 RepID=A0ABN5Z1G5_9MYCO|nr:hypothetical protein MAUB_48120 [Mycolicibacterium aubagnense]
MPLDNYAAGSIVPVGNYVYVPTASSVDVIDPSKQTVVTTIHLSAAPGNAVSSPASKEIYIATAANNVAVISTVSNTQVATIPLTGSGRYGLYANPNGKEVYVADSAGGPISVIDTGTYAVSPLTATFPNSGTLPVNAGSYTTIAVSTDGTKLLVAQGNTNLPTLTVVNTSTRVVSSTVTLPSGGWGYDILASPTDSNTAYVVQSSNGHFNSVVSVVNLSSGAITDTIQLNGFAGPSAISPDGKTVYVEDGLNSGIYIDSIDTTSGTIAGSISKVGNGIGQLIADPTGTYLYYPGFWDSNPNTVWQVNLATKTTSPIDFAQPTPFIGLSPDGSNLYAITNSGNTTNNALYIYRTGVSTSSGDTGSGGSTTAPVFLPLQMYENGKPDPSGGQPELNISAGGGQSIPVIVDTGSAGLVVDAKYVPSALLRASEADPNLQVSGYSYAGKNGSQIYYSGYTVPTTVTVGGAPTGNSQWPGQVTTGNTDVVAATKVWTMAPSPGLLGGLQYFFFNFIPYIFTGFNPVHLRNYTTLSAQFPGADGIMGIGPNAVGPGPIVTAALPGHLGAGELIAVGTTASSNYIAFGTSQDFGLGSVTGAESAPTTPVEVAVTKPGRVIGFTPNIEAIFDSGGNVGTIASSLVPGLSVGSQVPAGYTITVSTTGGAPIYSYTTGSNDGPIVVSGSDFNTGIIPFDYADYGDPQAPYQYQGLYIDNSGNGTLITPSRVQV